MDGDPVTGEPSSEISTLTEVFIKLCPYYMEMGMSYHDYWHLNTSAHKAYREAYEIRKHNDEWARHRQGAYFFHALMCAAPVIRAFSKATEPGKYPDEPWPLDEKEAKEREERQARERYMRMREKLMNEARQARKRREDAAKEASISGERSND